MTRRGRVGKWDRREGAKRHRKVLRGNIQGIKLATLRLATRWREAQIWTGLRGKTGCAEGVSKRRPSWPWTEQFNTKRPFSGPQNLSRKSLSSFTQKLLYYLNFHTNNHPPPPPR